MHRIQQCKAFGGADPMDKLGRAVRPAHGRQRYDDWRVRFLGGGGGGPADQKKHKHNGAQRQDRKHIREVLDEKA